jgi:hypothetical protein
MERHEHILRTRIAEFVEDSHHKRSGITLSVISVRTYRWNSLAVEWAYTDEARPNVKGQPLDGIATKNAEYWLLYSYNDTFGELPPWNVRLG